ncbi:hypothetical protein THARTR1_03256 [Trichoderma harzianum]|uniref:Major facilitator superfamily (MFS) profile domain-containing protein n=1 Tax=Trichoderma harzianum TaxID=5544 RepID=A0A2K0UFK3_TRIHA|nr:hypothetical protein THARTR1_03256 [Trichoderma harzianum]
MQESRDAGFILFMAAFSGLLIGFNLGSMTGILDVMMFSSEPNVPFQRELMASILPFGSILGALISWLAVDEWGVRSPLRWATLVWVFGTGLMSMAGRMTLVGVGRSIAGVGGRILSAIVPAYMVEIAPKDRRASFMGLLYVFIGLGILMISGTQFMASRLIGETVPKSDDPDAVVSVLRISFILQLFPGLVFMMFTLMMPQSPYTLASNGQWREAHALMAALEKRVATDPKLLAHYEQMRAEMQAQSRGGQPTLRMLLSPSERGKLILGLFTQLWNQLCGIHVLLYHTSYVIASAGVSWFPLAVVFVYLFNVLTTAMSGSRVADVLGRRLTLIIGSLVQYAELNLGYFEDPFFDNLDYVIRKPGVSSAVVVFASIFVVTYAATWGPTSWTYSTEIFPTHLRSRGVALCTASFWVGNLIMTLTVPSMLIKFDAKIYYVFALKSFVAFMYGLVAFRETQGGPLEEMDDLFNSEYFAWQFQPRGVKFEHLVSRFEIHPAVLGNAAGPEPDIELEAMDGNAMTDGAAV